MMLKQCLCAGAVCGGSGFMTFKVRSVDGDETGARDWFGGLLVVRAMRQLQHSSFDFTQSLELFWSDRNPVNMLHWLPFFVLRCCSALSETHLGFEQRNHAADRMPGLAIPIIVVVVGPGIPEYAR